MAGFARWSRRGTACHAGRPGAPAKAGPFFHTPTWGPVRRTDGASKARAALGWDGRAVRLRKRYENQFLRSDGDADPCIGDQ